MVGGELRGISWSAWDLEEAGAPALEDCSVFCDRESCYLELPIWKTFAIVLIILATALQIFYGHVQFFYGPETTGAPYGLPVSS